MSTTQTLSQLEWVRQQLEAGRTLTPFDALNDYGIMRLGARVWDLVEEGVAVKSRMVERTNRWGHTVRVAEYWLEQPCLFPN